MTTLDFSEKMVGLDGKPLVGPDGNSILMNKVVADVLVKSGCDNALKLYDLGTRLWKDSKISVDKSDFDTIYKAVSESDLMPLCKAPILRYMNTVAHS